MLNKSVNIFAKKRLPEVIKFESFFLHVFQLFFPVTDDNFGCASQNLKNQNTK